jgi:D-glucuronyl C5-epimerase C-terminus
MHTPDGAVYRAGLTGRYFHPLGSFARLNRVVSSGQRRYARRLAASLIARGHRRGRFGLVWYYNVAGGRSGWTSGMAQAVAAEALARAGRKRAARRAFLAIRNGLLIRLPQGPWIKLYGYSNVVVLNAQLQAALSIGRYARLTGDTRARLLARALRRTARALLPRFDSGSWSYYSLDGQGSSLEYHRYVTTLLWQLADRQAGGPWRAYANRFAKYHRLPPVLRRGDRAPEIFPEPADGFRDFARITFWLSKPATVTFWIAGTRSSQWFRRGWQTYHWWPEGVAPGRYPVWATAVDVAGNSTTRGLPWVRVARDTEAPLVKAALDGSALEWRASDHASPWFHARLERRSEGRVEIVELGRFDRTGAIALDEPPAEPGATILVVTDNSGNPARIPLCAAS